MNVLADIGKSIEQVPLFFLAMVLVVGPTAGLFIYRLITSQRARRASPQGEDLYWLCVACFSINRDVDKACYRCRMARGTAVPADPAPSRRPAPIPMARPANTGGRALGAASVPVAAQAADGVGVPVMADTTPRPATSPSIVASDEVIALPAPAPTAPRSLPSPVPSEVPPDVQGEPAKVAQAASSPTKTTRTRAPARSRSTPPPAPTPESDLALEAEASPPARKPRARSSATPRAPSPAIRRARSSATSRSTKAPKPLKVDSTKSDEPVGVPVMDEADRGIDGKAAKPRAPRTTTRRAPAKARSTVPPPSAEPMAAGADRETGVPVMDDTAPNAKVSSKPRPTRATRAPSSPPVGSPAPLPAPAPTVPAATTPNAPVRSPLPN